MRNSHLERTFKLPAQFPSKPKCPYCDRFSTKPINYKDNIAIYKCNNCGNVFSVRKDIGWRRALKYKAFRLPIIIKVENLRIKLTKKFIENKLRNGMSAYNAFGVPMYGLSWIDGSTLFADNITSTYKNVGDGFIISVLLNGFPLYSTKVEKLEGEVEV